MRMLLSVGFVVALAIPACSHTRKLIASPDEMGKAMYPAITAGDYERVRGLYPTEELLASVMTCKNPKMVPMVMYTVRTKRQQVIHSFKSAFKGVKFTWVGSKRLAQKIVKKGGEYKDCIFKVPVRFEQHVWSFTAQQGKTTTPKTGKVLVWRIGNKGWFLMRY